MDRQEIKLLFSFLFNNSKELTSLQNKFVSSLNDQFRLTGVITKRQSECLNELKDLIDCNKEYEAAFTADSDKYQAQYSSFDYGTLISVPD